jgi:hypothetical protein
MRLEGTGEHALLSRDGMGCVAPRSPADSARMSERPSSFFRLVTCGDARRLDVNPVGHARGARPAVSTPVESLTVCAGRIFDTYEPSAAAITSVPLPFSR